MGVGNGLIAVMVFIILGVGVTIPVVQEMINNSSLTGTTATIVGYLPLFIGVALLVATAKLMS